MKKLIAAASVMVAGAVLVVPMAAPAQAATPAKKYTAAQVKKHNKASDCWASVNGNVYNFTNWISKHPGGSGAITSICGKDGSKAFNAQHGSAGAANAALKAYKIGSLK
jgi:cytochrome b involved in lipid metabolism